MYLLQRIDIVKLKLIDYHTHTNFSLDTDRAASPALVIEAAIKKGLGEIAITDHLDFRYKTLIPQPAFDLEAYAAEILRLKEVYAGRVSVRFGIELGVHQEVAHLMDSIVDKHPFDFVICSTHDIKGLGIWDNDAFFAGKNKKDAHEEYLQEILAIISTFDKFNVYGHLDCLDRYGGRYYPDTIMRYSDHADLIDAIFTKLISAGKGIELNTSGFRYGLPHMNPKPDFLRRYRELGGEIITIGSDSHNTKNVGEDGEAAADLLRNLGFEYITCFEGMKPVMCRL